MADTDTFTRQEIGGAIRALYPQHELASASDDEISDALENLYPDQFLTRIHPKTPQFPSRVRPPTRADVISTQQRESWAKGTPGIVQWGQVLKKEPPADPSGLYADVQEGVRTTIGGPPKMLRGAQRVVAQIPQAPTPPARPGAGFGERLVSTAKVEALQRLGGASDVMEGLFETLTPTIPYAVAAEGVPAALTLGGAAVTQRIAQELLSYTNWHPEVKRFLENASTLWGATKIGKAAHQLRAGRATGASLAGERPFVEGRGVPEADVVAAARQGAVAERLGADAATQRRLDQRLTAVEAAERAIAEYDARMARTKLLPPARPDFIAYPEGATPVIEPTGRPGAPGIIAPSGTTGQPPPAPIDVLTSELTASLEQPYAGRPVPRLVTDTFRHTLRTPQEGPPTRAQTQYELDFAKGRRKSKPLAMPGRIPERSRIAVSPENLRTAGVTPREESAAQPRLEVFADLPGVNIDPISQKGLRWLAADLEANPYEGRTWDWTPSEQMGKTGNAAGGEANIIGRHAGTQVYYDIQVLSNTRLTYAQMVETIRKGLGEYGPNVTLSGPELRVFDAAQKIGRAWMDASMRDPTGKNMGRVSVDVNGIPHDLSRPLLPPEAGDLRTVANDLATKADRDPLMEAIERDVPGGEGEIEPGALADETAYVDAVKAHLLAQPVQESLRLLGPGAAGGPPMLDEAGRVVAPAQAPVDPAYAAHVGSSRGKKGMAPSAVFRFYQEVEPGQPPMPQYDVVGGELHGSTVSAETLRAKGIAVPETPPLNEAAQTAARNAKQAEIDRVFGRLPTREPKLEPQPVLPGTEAVRSTEIPTPQVAEAPFSLDREVAPSRQEQPSFFDRLRSEKGVLMFDVPQGDVTGIKQFLGRNERKYGHEDWFVRAEEALESGNHRRAWYLIASASAKELATTAPSKLTPEERAWVNEMAFAREIGRTETKRGVEMVTAPPVRPSRAGLGIKVAPGGILKPPVTRPLPPSVTDSLLGTTPIRMLLEEADWSKVFFSAEKNKTTWERAFRQVLGEQPAQGINTRGLHRLVKNLEPFRTMNPAQFDAMIGGQALRTVSEWGRGLNLVKQFYDRNKGTMQILDSAAEVTEGTVGAMSVNTEALRAQLRQRGAEPPPRGALRIGSRVLGVPGEIPANMTIDAIAKGGWGLDQKLAEWAVGERAASDVTALRAGVELGRTLILSKPVTAVRNFVTQEAYYSSRLVEETLAGLFEQTGGHTEAARGHFIQAAEMSKQIGRIGSTTPKRPWEIRLDTIFGYTRELLDTLPASDARKTLAMMEQMPVQMEQFLGIMSGGELTPGVQTVRPLPTRAGRAISSAMERAIHPKVRAALTFMSREAEFSQRAAMYDSTVRAGLRRRGLDVDAILSQKHPEVAVEQAIGKQGFEDVISAAVSSAMDITFAGGLLRNTLPGQLVSLLNEHYLFRLGYEFPRFQMTAMRVLYDHSPAALFEWLQMGRSWLKGQPEGRLARGMLAKEIDTTLLPELLGKKAEAKVQLGRAMHDQLTSASEFAVRQRQLQRLRMREAATDQPPLPEMGDKIAAAEEAFTRARLAREDARARYTDANQAIHVLSLQEGHMRNKLSEARTINAPDLAAYHARLLTGSLGWFALAYSLRSSAAAIGTKWNEIKDRSGRIINLRGFGPFIQTAFLADVWVDMKRNVDWDAYNQELGVGPGSLNVAMTAVTDPVDSYNALLKHYHGKYTLPTIGEEFTRAYLAVSQMAGTSKTFVDFMLGQGGDFFQRFAQAAIGTLGQLVGRYTVPLSAVRDVIGQFDPEEAIARIPSQVSEDQPYSPLAAALGNVPYVSRLIPPTVSQTIGEAFGPTGERKLKQQVAEAISAEEGVPLRAINPLIREFTGLSFGQRDDIRSIFIAAGVPGSSGYLANSGDKGLDNVRATVYAKVLNTYLPKVIDKYDQLFKKKTGKGWADQHPDMQRDVLQTELPFLKSTADGLVMQLLGAQAVSDKMRSPTETRRIALWQTLVRQQLDQYPPEPAEEPDPDAVPTR